MVVLISDTSATHTSVIKTSVIKTSVLETAPSDKRQATRQLLLEAARSLVAEKGHGSISIQEITKRASVSTGTYYNYFDTKQDVFVAVADEMRDLIAGNLETARESIKDPAMRVAVALKYYFDQALDNQEWREFTSFTGLTWLTLEQTVNVRIEDIERGVSGGRFKVDDVNFTESLIRDMVRHVTSAIDKGQVERNATDYAIRSILQMLGLPEIVAKALTMTALPPIAAPKRSASGSLNAKVVTSLAAYQGEAHKSAPTV